MNPLADYVFEASWEVCNKVGGIYTVISSKAEQMQSHYKNYFVIGPYFSEHARSEFTEQDSPEIFKKSFSDLRSENIICHYGYWNDVASKPKTILIEFLGIVNTKNDIKAKYWEDYQIDSMKGYWDFEEPGLWSYCVGKLIHNLYETSLNSKKIVAQFHEWLSGFGLLYLKKNCPNVATVFTTHATVLGRTLASNGIDLYSNLKTIDVMKNAYRFNVEAKHLTEKAAAINADVFTTVSEITGIEAEIFLGRKPDVLTYNGLDIDTFQGFEDILLKHKASREKIKEFLTYTYFPYYTFDLDANLLFYTIGRYEFHNKGYDLLIRALGKLNQILKNDPSNHKTVTVFFWIPMQQHGLNMTFLENKNYYMHIKNYVNMNGSEMMTRMIYDIVSKKGAMMANSLIESISLELHKDLIAFERTGNPPLSTHYIDEQNNEVAQAFKKNGLLNTKDDMIKVMIQPVYLDGNDGFLDMTYYDAMAGCHLGLFPSYYEPWGYTPLESVAVGVPALTTDLSGFGSFIKKHGGNIDGVYVLDRFGKDETVVLDTFVNVMHSFLKYDPQKRMECKMNAKHFSTLADWKLFVEYYVNAHNIALSNMLQRTHNTLKNISK